jgi:hypothetical protein
MTGKVLEFKNYTKCKVCKIEKEDQTFFDYFHGLRFKDNLSLSALIEKIRIRFMEKGIQLLLPNEVNLSNHFSKHIPLDLASKYKAQSLVRASQQSKAIKKETIQTSTIVKEKIAIYDEFEKLYSKFKGVIEEFERKENNQITALNWLPYTSLIRELKSFLVELNKMNSNEQIVKLVLQTAFQQYTLGALQGTLKECDLFKMSLKSYIKEYDVVEKLVDMHQSRLYDCLSSSSKEAINLVKEEYKIA